jgi:hypothetical protein
MTPELIDLLAFQKLQADKKQAANQMALSMGEQPTVAQGMRDEAMNSARDEVTKSMGLPGLMQAGPQAAPPQNRQQMAPQRPPQQGAPQGAPQGAGLASAQSNLPKQYQNGGIVAFDEGGDVDDARAKEKAIAQAMSKLGTTYRREYPEQYQGALTAQEEAKQERAAAEERYAEYMSTQPEGQAYIPQGGIAKARQERRTQPITVDVSADEALAAANADRVNWPGQGRREAGPPVQTFPGAKEQRAPAPKDERKQGLGATGPAQEQRAKVVSETDTADAALKQKLQEIVMDRLGRNKETEGAAGQERYSKDVGAGNLEIIKDQIARAEGLRALQAKNAGERPSEFWRLMQAAGKNVHSTVPGLGGAFSGVAEAIDTQNAGYAEQDVKNMSAVNALLDAADKAKKENNIGAYNAYTAAAKEAMDEQKSAQTTGASLVNTTEQARSREEMKRQGGLDRASRERVSLGERLAVQRERLDQQQDTNAFNRAAAAVKAEMEIPGRASQLQKQGIDAAALTGMYYRKFLAMQRATDKGAPDSSGGFTAPSSIQSLVNKYPGK